MAKKSLQEYVKGLMQKGHDTYAIRNFLLKYGYSENEINDAINSTFKQTIRHEIHLSHTTVLVIIFIFASLLGVASFFYYKPSSIPSPAELLDLNLEPVTTAPVQAGDNFIFIKEFSNLGSAKRYDVVVRQEILDAKTNKVITQKIETRAIETFGSTQTKILVPQDTKPGDYILRAIVEYDGKKAVATLPIKVIAKAISTAKKEEKESCFDGIKNQNEQGVDCGGVCSPCKVQTEVISPKQETSSNLMSTPTLDEIKETARVDAGKASQQCNQIEVPDLKDTCIANIGEVQRNRNYCSQIANARIKDLCYTNIAKINNDNSLCADISIDSRKDACYMTFVLDNHDYSVCDKITNAQLRQSCESLKRLNEINQEQNQTQGENQ